MAYQGVLLLEGKDRIGWGVAWLVTAAVTLIAAGGGHHLPEGDDPARRDGDVQRGGGPWSRARRCLSSPAAGWWLLLALAFGVGAAFRLYEIRSLPFGVWFDEAQNGLVAHRILEDPNYRPVFIGDRTQLPALFFYVFALALKLVGHGILALRLVSTAAGILTLVFTYLLARELFDRRVAALATLLLAVMRWHVNFSRFAVHGILTPLFMAATLFFLVRGLKGKGTSSFVAAGIMMGVGLQGYYSFLLVPFVIAPFLVHHVAFARMLPWRRLAAGLAAFALVTAAVYAPVAWWGLRHPEEFGRRASNTTITAGRSPAEVSGIVWRSTRQHLLMFSSAGDRNGRHNIPGTPMLDRVTGLLFALGVGLALRRWRDPSHFLLLVWVAVILQAGIWSVEWEAPQAHRTLGLTPAVAMLAALPLGLLWRLSAATARTLDPVVHTRPARFAARSSPAVAAIVTVALIAYSAWSNFDTYFHKQHDRADVWPDYSTDTTLVANEMMRLGPEHEFRLATALIDAPTIDFITMASIRGRILPFHWARDLPASSDGPVAYFLEGAKEGYLRWIGRLYPEASIRAFTAPTPGSPVVLYEAAVPAAAVHRLRGLDAVYTPAGAALLRRREAALDLDWSAGAPGPLPIDAVWSGFLSAPEYRVFRLDLEAPGAIRLLLDGESVGEGRDHISVERPLYQGAHQLRVEARIGRPGRVLLSWDGAPVSAASFFACPFEGNGLLGHVFTNDRWEGEPVHAELAPLIGFNYHAELVLDPPLSFEWRGFLEAPVAGEYGFRLQANELGSLAIDGRELLSSSGVNTIVEGRLSLEAGRHQIEVRLLNRGGHASIFLYWTIPGGSTELIPPERLAPR
jgi:4-amino-4-deoxy-L-arabinose transferase-like glycosyltransferase